MRVTSFLARTEGNVAESKILFLIQNYLLHTLLGNLSAIFPYFYTYFHFIFSVTHNTLRSHAILLAHTCVVLWHVRMLLMFELLRLFTVEVVERTFVFQWRRRNFV